MIDTAARCSYSRCRAELPTPGPQGGRPRSFCRDPRWEGGRTCAQMARNERDALDALGLDGGGTTFRLDADRLREHIDAVRTPVGALAGALDAVSARLDEVQRDAVAAVEVAHRRGGGAGNEGGGGGGPAVPSGPTPSATPRWPARASCATSSRRCGRRTTACAGRWGSCAPWRPPPRPRRGTGWPRPSPPATTPSGGPRTPVGPP